MYCPHCQKALQEPIPAACPYCGEKLPAEAAAGQTYAPNQKPMNPTPRPAEQPETDRQAVSQPKPAQEDTSRKEPAVVKAEKTPGGRNPMMIVFAALLVVALLGALVFGAVSIFGKKSDEKKDSGKEALSGTDAVSPDNNDADGSENDPSDGKEAAEGGSRPGSISAATPGIHSYEFVQDTCSWHEAQKLALKKGGHLACFETAEEYAYLLTLLPEQSPLCYFRIGARRDLEDTAYHWTDGDDRLFGETLNAQDAWCSDVWREGEPNITWKDTIEAYVVLCYNWDHQCWEWIDVADETSASLNAETVGYIIEYEPQD